MDFSSQTTKVLDNWLLEFNYWKAQIPQDLGVSALSFLHCCELEVQETKSVYWRGELAAHFAFCENVLEVCSQSSIPALPSSGSVWRVRTLTQAPLGHSAAEKAKGIGTVYIKYSTLLGDGLDFHVSKHICLLVHVFGSIPVNMYMQVKCKHIGC